MTGGTGNASTYGVRVFGFWTTSALLPEVPELTRSAWSAKCSNPQFDLLFAPAPEKNPAPVNKPIRSKSRRSIFNPFLPCEPGVRKRSHIQAAHTKAKRGAGQ